MTRITIIASGPELVGGRVRSFDGVFVDLMRGARQELQFASYYMMPQRLVFSELEAAVRRGVKTVIILNRFWGQSAVTKRFLCRLLKYKNLLLYSFEKSGSDLHAKVIVSDRSKADRHNCFSIKASYM